jgi:acyl-CoA synthetase (AMP-forming)/AMP-acid ligase II
VSVELHYATVWETVADTVPDQPAAVHGTARLTWAELDDQAARLAQAFADRGVGPGTKVALLLYNGVDFLVAQYAVFKLRGVAVNVNYRYLGAELAYVLDNSDSEVVVYHTSLAPQLGSALVPGLAANVRTVVAVDDGGAPLEGSEPMADLVTSTEPAPRIHRPGDDVYMLYTGGTTGYPKGVMYRHADHSRYIQGLGYQWIGLEGPSTVDEVPAAVRRAHAHERGALRSVVPPPFIHGTGTWLGVFATWGMGGAVITLTPRSFDAHELWRTVERERASAVIIVGDAFARPMLAALDDARVQSRPYDVASLHTIVSSGALWTADVMRGLLAHADLQLIDSMGSTEGGMGSRVVTRATVDEPARFRPRPGVKVLDEDGVEVGPGSGRPGLIACPARAFGYYKDADKTAVTFRTIDSRPYVVPGDWATVEPDGQLRVLGRGSQCINTGGEKVFPEEVETELAAHPGIEDCTVVGMPHPRLGQEVVAVIAPVDGVGPTDAAVRDWVRGRLAGYKAPRRVVFVDRVQRLPNGKPDYPWAREVTAARPAERSRS